MKYTFACVVGIAATCAFVIPRVFADDAPAKRIVIHSQSELPIFSCKVATPTASERIDFAPFRFRLDRVFALLGQRGNL